VIIAVHHPPFSYRPNKNAKGAVHGGSPAMLRQIDAICQKVGVYPHAFISGHAHNYQHYTRTISFARGADDYQVPYIVCGNSGHNVTPLVDLVDKDYKHTQDPADGSDVSYLDSKAAVTSKGLTIDYSDDFNYGYLRATVDKNTLTVNLRSHRHTGRQAA
jgi:hypothetical protein